MDITTDDAKADNDSETLPEGHFSIKQFSAWAGIKHTKIYDLLDKKELQGFKAGSRTLIPIESAKAWRAALPPYRSRAERSPRKLCGPKAGPQSPRA